MPSPVSSQNVLVTASAILLFLYFFQKPEIDVITSILIFGIWAVSMIMDLQITLANESYIARHEHSLVLAFVYKRFQRNFAIFLAVLTESSCVVFFPFVITLETNVGISIAIAYFFALLHIIATHGNQKFVSNAA